MIKMNDRNFEPNTIRRFIISEYGKEINEKIADQRLSNIKSILRQEQMTAFKQRIFAYYGIKNTTAQNGICEHHDPKLFLVTLWEDIIKSQDK